MKGTRLVCRMEKNANSTRLFTLLTAQPNQHDHEVFVFALLPQPIVHRIVNRGWGAININTEYQIAAHELYTNLP